VDQVSYSLYQPLVFLAVIAGALYVVGGVVRARGNPAGGERLLDIGFGVALLAGAYVVILLLLAAFDEPDLIYDALVNVLVVVAFFAALLGLLFALFELLLTRGRGRARSSRESD
jgi:hypothetical protein